VTTESGYVTVWIVCAALALVVAGVALRPAAQAPDLLGDASRLARDQELAG
jgi:hypothetical protein